MHFFNTLLKTLNAKKQRIIVVKFTMLYLPGFIIFCYTVIVVKTVGTGGQIEGLALIWPPDKRDPVMPSYRVVDKQKISNFSFM